MVHFDAPHITIHWDEGSKCVIMEWKTFVKGADFRKALDTGLDLLKSKGTGRWLADLRNIGVVTQEDQKWSNEDWFPRALQGGIKSMALVVPKSALAEMSVEAIMTKVTPTLTTHYFKDVEEAKAWLKTQ